MGNPVILNYRSNAAAAAGVKRMIGAEGGAAELLSFDTSDPAAVEEALDRWEAAHPDDYVAVLVNNAGVRADAMMFMMSDDDWNRVVGTSLGGFFHVTR